MSAKIVDPQKEYENALAAYHAHMESRKSHQTALLEVSGRFTQWMLTVSGGALALTITYVEKMTPTLANGSGWLMASWITLSASVLCTLFSLHMSARATLNAIKHEDSWYLSRLKNPDEVFASPINSCSEHTGWLSVVALITFALGMIFFCLFTWYCPPHLKS
jgi:hypothetical protein